MGSSLVLPNLTTTREFTDTEAAYLAGLLDGEGTISLYCVKQDSQKRTHSFKPAVAVSNTDMGMMERVLRITGCGKVVQSRLDDGMHKPCFRWLLSPLQIEPVLRRVLPYLDSKQRQAELLLSYLRMLGGKSIRYLTDEEYLSAVGICNHLRRLNQRGPIPLGDVEVGSRERKHPGPGATQCLEEGCDRPRYLRGSGFCYDHWKALKAQQEPKTCEHCGQPFVGVLSHGRFCSAKCQAGAYHERVRQPAVLAEKAQRRRLCPGCSQYFTGGKKDKRYCSANCQSKHRRLTLFAEKNGLPKPAQVATAKRARDIIIDRTCPQCGVVFQAPRGKRTFCTPACVQKASLARKQTE